MDELPNSLRGFIFDIEGTLIHDGNACPGSVELLKTVKQMGLKTRFVTNTTTRSPHELSQLLRKFLRMNIQPEEIFTSVTVCCSYLNQRHAHERIFFAIPRKTEAIIRHYLPSFNHNDDSPDFIVLGDLDNAFNYTLLNKIYNYLVTGAELIAFHKNPYYFKDGKQYIDSGMFTIGLENITGINATITGKPSSLPFQMAIKSMHESNTNIMVVGDDIYTDIQGAQTVGLASLLVKSGKFHPSHLKNSKVHPTYCLDSLMSLNTLLLNSSFK